MSVGDPFVRHELRTLFRLARHLQRRDEIGAAAEQADLDDLERLLGARPHHWRDGEAKLEAFVLADVAGRHDYELVRLFHKRNLRAHSAARPGRLSNHPPPRHPTVHRGGLNGVAPRLGAPRLGCRALERRDRRSRAGGLRQPAAGYCEGPAR